jgi:hypothetical protein
VHIIPLTRKINKPQLKSSLNKVYNYINLSL